MIYTVTGFWLQTGEIYTLSVEATGPVMAVGLFQLHGQEMGGTLIPGPVFTGEQQDVSPYRWLEPNATKQEHMDQAFDDWRLFR